MRYEKLFINSRCLHSWGRQYSTANAYSCHILLKHRPLKRHENQACNYQNPLLISQLKHAKGILLAFAFICRLPWNHLTALNKLHTTVDLGSVLAVTWTGVACSNNANICCHAHQGEGDLHSRLQWTAWMLSCYIRAVSRPALITEEVFRQGVWSTCLASTLQHGWCDSSLCLNHSMLLATVQQLNTPLHQQCIKQCVYVLWGEAQK